jgi:hypothetical protein
MKTRSACCWPARAWPTVARSELRVLANVGTEEDEQHEDAVDQRNDVDVRIAVLRRVGGGSAASRISESE